MIKKAKGIVKSKDALAKDWNRALGNKLKLSREANAAIVTNNDNETLGFIMDTTAMLDLLSIIDESALSNLSDAKYNSKKANPAGMLIDEIENSLPVNPEYANAIKNAIKGAKKNGTVPLSELKKFIKRK